MKIPFSPPYIDEAVINEVVDSLRSGWITSGPKVKALEEEIKVFSNEKEVLCVNSWTSGAIMILRWLGVTAEDEVIVPVAMNIGIKASIGDIVMRLDAHAQYPPNYFSVLVKELVRLRADNVGVACKTDVLNKTSKTLAIREVLSNRFGVGNSTFRLGVDKVIEVDTVPFGCWKKDVFNKYGFYDERLIRNQDIELNKRIVRGGGHIFIVPDTYCTYLARETFDGLAKNNFGNGKWNILTVYYTKQFKSLSVRHFIPLLFLLSLIVPSILACFYFPIGIISLISLLLYTKVSHPNK